MAPTALDQTAWMWFRINNISMQYLTYTICTTNNRISAMHDTANYRYFWLQYLCTYRHIWSWHPAALFNVFNRCENLVVTFSQHKQQLNKTQFEQLSHCACCSDICFISKTMHNKQTYKLTTHTANNLPWTHHLQQISLATQTTQWQHEALPVADDGLRCTWRVDAFTVIHNELSMNFW